MADLRKYSREFVMEFIELYKSFPSLWKIKSKEYSDREQKSRDYECLVRKFREVEPSADRILVVKKIKSLRCVYRRELKKIQDQRSGMGADEVPSSNLWYFDLLSFLKDQETPRPSFSSMDLDETQDILQESADNYSIVDEPGTSVSPTPSIQVLAGSSSAINTSSNASQTSSRRRKGGNQSVTSQREEVLSKISKQLDTEPTPLDRFEYSARGWAGILRSLPKEQQIFAESIINDVFFAAQLGNLSVESARNVKRILAESNRQPSPNDQCDRISEVVYLPNAVAPTSAPVNYTDLRLNQHDGPSCISDNTYIAGTRSDADYANNIVHYVNNFNCLEEV